MSVTRLVTTPDSGSTPNATGSFTPTAGTLLVVVLVGSASTSDSDDVPTASANGITFVRANTVLQSTNSHDQYVANQLVPASPASMTVSWAPTDVATSTVIDVYEVTGMARTGASAIRQVDTATGGAGTTPECVFPASCLTGNATIVSVANLSAPAGVTEPSSWTEANDTSCSTPTAGLEVAYRLSGFTGTTVTWQSTSATAWSAAALELDFAPLDDPALDGSVVIAESTSGAATTAGRDVATDRSVWIFVTHNNSSAAAITSTVTDNSASITPALVLRKNTQQGTTAEVWRGYNSSGSTVSGYTVTATGSNGGTGTLTRTHIVLAVFSGEEVTAGGATNSASNASGLPSVALTTTRDVSWVWAVKADWSAGGTGTPGTGQELVDSYHTAVEYTSDVWRQVDHTASASTSVTSNETAPSAQNYNLVAVEIRQPDAGGTNAAAESASGTGSANNTTSLVSTGPSSASGTGSANNPGPLVKPSAGTDAATGTADNPSASIRVSAGVATGAGVAENPTVNTGGAATNAPAGLATGAGSADNPSVAVQGSAGSASGTGTANSTTSKVSPTPTTATGSGTANNPTVQTGSFTNAQAGTATGTGTANNPSGKTAPVLTTATGTGVADNPAVTVGHVANAGTATGTGTANNATPNLGRSAMAGTATAIGTANLAALAIQANAEAAAALGQAFDALISGGEINAQSVTTLTAGRTSVAAVTAGRTSAALVGAAATSTPAVSD